MGLRLSWCPAGPPMAVILWNLYYMAHSNHMIYKITRTKCCWGRVWATQTCKKRKWKQIKIIIKTNSWHFKKICLLFCIVWSKVRKNGAKNTENILDCSFFSARFHSSKTFAAKSMMTAVSRYVLVLNFLRLCFVVLTKICRGKQHYIQPVYHIRLLKTICQNY